MFSRGMKMEHWRLDGKISTVGINLHGIFADGGAYVPTQEKKPCKF